MTMDINGNSINKVDLDSKKINKVAGKKNKGAQEAGAEEKLATVGAERFIAYNSNINKLSPEEKFDKGLTGGVQLSDGSILMRPTILNTGSTEIKALPDGKYEVTFTSFAGGFKHEPKTRILSEGALFADKALCAGAIKQNDDGTYQVTYYKDSGFKDHTLSTETMTKEECMKFMQERFLHF